MDTPALDATAWRLIVFFWKDQRRACAAVFLSGLASMALELSGIFSLLPLLSLLMGSAFPAETLGGPGRAWARLLAASPLADPLGAACVLTLALTVLQLLARLANGHLIARARGRLLFQAQKDVCAAYARRPYAYFLDAKQGQLIYIATRCASNLAVAMTALPQAAVESVRSAALAALLFWLDWRAALALSALLLAFDLLAVKRWSALSYDIGRRMRDADWEERNLLTEFIAGIKTLTVFNVKERWLARFDAASREYCALFVNSRTLQELPRPVLETLVLGFVVLSILAARSAGGDVAARLPFLGTVAVAALKLLPSLTALSRLRMEFLGHLSEIEAVHAALAAPPAPRPRVTRPFAGLSRSIRFEQVRFAHPGRAEILKGIDIEFPRHGSTLITGATGAGKTTVLNLLLGLFSPTSGRILIDGVDLAELEPRSWLDRVAVVAQDPFIYHASIAENIALGRADYTAARIQESARLAQAHAFIETLPARYDTVVGERGMKLSGGQQGLLALARALAKDPEILILDEPASALDEASASAMYGALRAASAGRTTILVAHRAPPDAPVERVVSLQDGRIVDLLS